MKQFFAAVMLSLIIPVAALASLGSDVDAVLKDKLLQRATVGIEIVALGETPAQTRILLQRTQTTPLIPASNLKLITTAAALEGLGADFNFSTRLVKHGDDLIIVGDGDPTLGDVELTRPYGWGTTTVFESWAAALAKIKDVQVRNVLVDDSVFEQTFVHPNWPGDQLNLRYVAGVGGLNLNANCIDFYLSATRHGALVEYELDPPTQYAQVRNSCTTDDTSAASLAFEPGQRIINLRGTFPGSRVPLSVTVDDPGLFAATVLKETLVKAGIAVSGTVSRDNTARAALDAKNPQYVLLAQNNTAIATVIDRANKDSMNLYAESLCKRLGHAKSGQPGSWQNGPAAISAFLKTLGVSADQFSLDDGCGLSKENEISAHAISLVLQHMYFSKNRQTYIDSLSVAGVAGTLDDRFRGSSLRGRVFAKSGFVNGVSSLSGFFQGHDEKWYAFSILMNGIPPKSNSMIKPLQERIVKAADAQTK
jgi:D-alanyl-D-alanine carboxypeptidase/D-alanyl-D-alanine-endopeptidase (penicillin-binding protein 4)